MFEKESNGMSEDERTDFVIALKRKMCLENGKVTDADVYFQGVKDGYNKANEWHYVKDGDLPKGLPKPVLVAFHNKFSDNIVTDVARYSLELNKWWFIHDLKDLEEDVIAWKEIVLPKDNA